MIFDIGHIRSTLGIMTIAGRGFDSCDAVSGGGRLVTLLSFALADVAALRVGVSLV